MGSPLDDGFYDRADAFIHLANRQLAEATRGRVSASLMYATARFNAWVSAQGFGSGAEMEAAKAEAIEYFVGQYRSMLVENLDDYSGNFDKYLRAGDSK